MVTEVRACPTMNNKHSIINRQHDNDTKPYVTTEGVKARGMRQCQWGTWALFRRATAVGKKLSLCLEVLVQMDRSLLQEGSDSKSLCPGWEGSTR